MNRAFNNLQILPPFDDDEVFEEFITEYFNDLYNTNTFDRFGRSGQKQDGLDIFSIKEKTVVQCKLKQLRLNSDEKIREDLISELKSDFCSFTAYNEKNNLFYNRFIFISTFHRDTEIQTECVKLSNDQVLVEYWSWDRLFEQIPLRTWDSYHRHFLSQLEDYFNPTKLNIPEGVLGFQIDKEKHILDQTYDALTFLYREVNILPIHILKKAYPVTISQSFYSHYSSFTLSTDNKELFELFDSIEFTDEGITVGGRKVIRGVKDLRHKVEFITKKLNNNLVFNLKHKGKVISIRKIDDKYCDCINCSLERLDFHSVFSRLSEEPKKIKDKFDWAYVNYKLGNYIESAKHISAIANASKNNRIRYAISQFDLSKLYVFIRNYNWKNSGELQKELKEIDLDGVFQELKNEQNKDLLNWIHHTKFYYSSKEKITHIVGKIRDHYYTQKNGGWSSNSHIAELYNEFAVIDTFLNGNHIIYDSFSEYQELTGQFIEGVVCSHSMNDNQTSKLRFFDDWIIQRIVSHAKTEELLKHIRRYEVETIKYQRNEFNDSSFLNLLDNFFTKHEGLRAAFETSCESQNHVFWDHYNQYFSNLLVLAAYCDIDEQTVIGFSKDLWIYLKNEDFITPRNIKYVRIFLNKKGQHLGKEILHEFIQIELQKAKFHDQELITTAVDQLKKKFKRLEFEEEQFKELFTFAFDECTTCKGKHQPDFILDIFQLVDDHKIKMQISERIIDKLQNRFESNLYYLSVMHNVIEVEDGSFSKYIDIIKPRENRSSYQSIFTGTKDNRFHQVNNLLDICFKYDIDLADSKFNAFRNLDVYYEWLFNMEGFDYSKFTPSWTYEYWTVHYINQYKKNSVIQNKIKDYLETKVDSELERIGYILCNESKMT